MTEEEWFTEARRVASPRKFQLLMAGCCRREWGRYGIPMVSRVIEVVEGYADGKVAAGAIDSLRSRLHSQWLWGIPVDALLAPANRAAAAAREFLVSLKANTLLEHAVAAQATRSSILRDVIGDPFEPARLEAEWLTSTVVQLARGMYESRDFSAMPILADALQDAGCEDEQILAHCRNESAVHVRGCWVVDLVLGKS